MSNASSRELVPGTIGKPNIITRGLMIRGRRPRSRVQTESKRWWLLTAVILAALTSGELGAQQPANRALIEEGHRIFFKETFDGNGRTCGTCHPATHNFTIDAEFIARLPDDDPLFVAEFNPDLAELEDPELMRERGLILENLDGFAPNDPVFRGVPHNIGMSVSIAAAPSHGGPNRDAVGWSGDGAPGAGTIRDFLLGAITQHFPQTLARVPGDDFRLPSEREALAVEAFMLSLGRRDELDLEELSFADPDVEAGRLLFMGEDGANRACSFCHDNAGANTADGLNENFDTGAHGLDPSLPPDDGFGRNSGDGTFNTVSLIEAADTPPFFHNNSAATIEDAVEFYTTDIFGESPAGRRDNVPTPFNLTPLQVDQVAAFLRVINARFNLSNSNVLSVEAEGLDIPRGRERIREVIAESEDAIEVLSGGPFGTNFRPLVGQVRRALGQDRRALAARQVNQRNAALAQARQLKEGVAESLLAPSELASVAP